MFRGALPFLRRRYGDTFCKGKINESVLIIFSIMFGVWNFPNNMEYQEGMGRTGSRQK